MKSTNLHASLSGGKSSPFVVACLWVTFFALAVLSVTLTIPEAFAAGSQDLNNLETRFFEHTYLQDTTEDRLTRLEKMVFGEARSGDDQTRLHELVNAVPAPPTSDNSRSQTQSQAGLNQSASRSDNQSGSSNPQDSTNSTQAPQSDGDSDTTSGTDYPRVTELETVLLGKTYQGEPIKHRLDQLELKIFGKSHAGEDLADRVDRIAQYADKKFHGGPGAVSQQAEPVNGSIEQKVAWLETQIEGQAFPQKTMIERLRPLEQAMFPTDPTDIHASIPEQVNMLMSAVELLHKQQAGQASGDQALSIAPLVQRQQQPQQQTGYARQSNYDTDLQREFEDDNAPAPTQNYSANYHPQQAYQGAPSYGQSQPAYTQSQSAQQSAYNQQAQNTSNAQKSHGHPFFRGLAKALGEVGAMVGSSVMQGGMMGGGGYGMPGAYGMGNGGAVFGFP
ncbi:MAG: hypothetical protein IT342_01980 [Candidatus Melainabacteria bacterium]|nr:hypothetical protein [Candidatus Melainabacteria bacterium]